jgi:hypothetical protein
MSSQRNRRSVEELSQILGHQRLLFLDELTEFREPDRSPQE